VAKLQEKNVMRLEHKVNASADGKGACVTCRLYGALCARYPEGCVGQGVGG